jgi:hypothetical protein
MHPAHTHAEAVRSAIEGMEGTLALARALVEGGRQVDLAGLDGEATALCAAVMTLAPAQGRALRPALEALLRQVDGLAAHLAATG